jgi:hypothetical protein
MGFIRYGTHKPLDDAATEIIRKSLEGVTKYSEKADILTPWKEQDRRNREVYTEAGAPDASMRKGMFHRVHNPERPDLNRGRSSSIQSHVAEFGENRDGRE